MGDDRSGSDADPQAGHRLSPFGQHAEQERAGENRQEDGEREGHEAPLEERDRGGVDEECRGCSEREPPPREQRQEEHQGQRDEHPKRTGRGLFVVLTTESELERGFEHAKEHESVEAETTDQRPGPAGDVDDAPRHVLKVDHRRQSVVVREDDFKIIRSDE